MRSSRSSDNSGAIGLFPFLAVLLCTMGALLVLLVVLAEQAKRSVAAERAAAVVEVVAGPTDMNGVDAAELAQRLEQVRRRAVRFAELEAEAEQRLREEQARLSHVEEHARRIEHDLAKLYVAGQQLEATEQNQNIDREQAKRELERLTKLAEETRERLEERRQESTGGKSYAIMPYKGSNGTERRPIYVECTSEGVVIQPEGIKLTEQDFAGPRRPGNPLASAMRAAAEHLNARRNSVAGDPPPDPYPLLIVRPGGGRFYNAALRSIRDWDAAFGYEFIDDDKKLKYTAIDPLLAQSMQHAVEQARQRQQVLAEIAPNRYGSLVGRFSPAPGAAGGQGGLAASPSSIGGEGVGDSEHYGGGDRYSSARGMTSDGGAPSGAEDEIFAAAADPATGPQFGEHGLGPPKFGNGGDQRGTVQTTDPGGNDEGLLRNDSELTGEGGQLAGRGNVTDSEQRGTTTELYEATGSTTAGADRYSQSSPPTAGSARQSSGQQGGAPSAGASSGQYASPAGSPSSSMSGGAPPPTDFASATNSGSRGIHWDQRMRSPDAVLVRRPVRVAVYADRIALLERRGPGEDPTPTGAVIMLNQSTRNVRRELSRALNRHVEQWGVAGSNLYWNPELILDPAGGAETNAAKLVPLLNQIGVDVRPLESAARPAEVGEHGAR